MFEGVRADESWVRSVEISDMSSQIGHQHMDDCYTLMKISQMCFKKVSGVEVKNFNYQLQPGLTVWGYLWWRSDDFLIHIVKGNPRVWFCGSLGEVRSEDDIVCFNNLSWAVQNSFDAWIVNLRDTWINIS